MRYYMRKLPKQDIRKRHANLFELNIHTIQRVCIIKTDDG